MATFPLSVHASGRYFVTASGTPFYMYGEAPWSLIAELNLTDVQQYLNDRQSKGFNTLLVNVIEWNFTSHSPHWRNANGDLAFANVNNMNTPNDAYFDYAVSVCNEAASRGMLVYLTPAYLGFEGASPAEGWYDTMVTNGASKLRTYGQYLGTKFSSCNNIIWVNGGDRDPADRNLVDQVALGIKDNDSSKLFTAHANQNSNPRTIYSGSTWIMCAGGVYTYNTDIYTDMDSAYTESPTKPCIMMESRYENESDWTAQRVRRQCWWALTSGMTGWLYGNNPVWNFGTGWQTSLGDAGSSHMKYLKNVTAARQWHKLVPNTNTSIVTTGRGTVGNVNRAGVARASDGSFIICYFPDSRAININLTNLSGPVIAKWLDPTNGTTQNINGGSPFSNAITSQAFTMPGNNSGGDPDWALLLDTSIKTAQVCWLRAT